MINVLAGVIAGGIKYRFAQTLWGLLPVNTTGGALIHPLQVPAQQITNLFPLSKVQPLSLCTYSFNHVSSRYTRLQYLHFGLYGKTGILIKR